MHALRSLCAVVGVVCAALLPVAATPTPGRAASATQADPSAAAAEAATAAEAAVEGVSRFSGAGGVRGARGISGISGVSAVERVSGAARADTAAALARAATSSPSRILLVAGTDFADGLAAGVTAARTGGVVLLAGPGGLPAATTAYLTDHPGTEVALVGGTARLPASVAASVQAVTGEAPDRVAGADRYGTAAALSRLNGEVDTVWIVSGTQPADALAAGAAAADGGALLLARGDHLPDETARALTALAPRRAVVVGGPAAVADGVLDDLRALVSLVSPVGAVRVDRRAGADRYATAAAVAQASFPDASAALVTTGRTWADALAATPLAAQLQAPVLLVPRRCVTDDAAAVLDRVDRVVIAGGQVAVSPRVETLSRCSDEIAQVTGPQLGRSWRLGCPVPPLDLRRVTVDYRRLEDGGVEEGSLVVHRSVAADIVRTFDGLFSAGARFARVTTAAEYGGDDNAAMAANATTAFNCRAVTGRPGVWSEHAYGTAIDVNPVQNPYVAGDSVLPPAGRAYLDRSDVRPGMVVAGDAVDRAFAQIGWSWGGRWQSIKDYQHFSARGR